jgi:hypothetical protein
LDKKARHPLGGAPFLSGFGKTCGRWLTSDGARKIILMFKAAFASKPRLEPGSDGP